MKTEETGTGAGGQHVGPLLDAYRTGELDASDGATVEAHLEACHACREELAALGPWTAAIERGYAALREEGRELAPDWAAQRAAVVARTSGRRSREREGWFFRRWAPQVALVAVAALIVGVVWWDQAVGPGGEPVVSTSERQAGGPEERTATAPEERATAPERSDDEDASRFAQEQPRAEAAGRDDALADAPAPVPDAAPPAAARAAPEEQARARELPEADEPGLAEGLPLGKAAQTETERFERDARAALGARDTAAARRALVLWSDTLAPAGADRHAALADSLREFLAPE